MSALVATVLRSMVSRRPAGSGSRPLPVERGLHARTRVCGCVRVCVRGVCTHMGTLGVRCGCSRFPTRPPTHCVAVCVACRPLPWTPLDHRLQDQDGDGTISFQEFMYAMRAVEIQAPNRGYR